MPKRKAKEGFSPVLAVFKGGKTVKTPPPPPAKPDTSEFDVKAGPLNEEQARKRGRASTMQIRLGQGAGVSGGGGSGSS